ncbi:hypothetical protein JZ751_010694 [Albula glossodonta]|uniref:Ig-like domain-containing protein n=1 Tax=Albula glossodonta TaxID=121402 RepID=A0A8T2N0N9_9TELE|nr:hypothetical protein JZ751_010694 [Albula glossodonta]
MVDDEQFMYYDSNIKEAIPKAEWMEIAEDKNYWDTETQRLRGEQQRFRAMIVNVRNVYEQTGDGFWHYGYDGEDFLAFDMKNMRWITPVKQAFVFALRWNHNQAQLDYEKNYLTQTCIDWVKKYVSYGRSTLERRVPPEVFLFQKDSSSPVVCHATGFFPHGIIVTWQRDGEEVQESVEQGETLPNEDGTFQITSYLTVKLEDTHTYTCTVQHKSLEQDIVRTRGLSPGGDSDSSAPPMGIIIGCVVEVLIIALAVIGVVMWKKRTAVATKKKWDKDRAFNERRKNYLTQECIGWLKKYVSYGRSTLERRDGEGQEDVVLGEMLPNGDGTFQITSRLTVKPEDWKTHTYTCTVQHKSLQEDIIKTHSFSSGSPMGIIISCVVVGLLLALIGIFMWRKRSTDFPEFVDVEMWEYEAMSNKKQTEEYLDRLYWELVNVYLLVQ